MKVHLILNSHLDPVWLWKRAQGVDEVLATARTGCDLLDLYPEIIITRGEMWFYETVEQCDPELFARLKAYVKAGRWRVVGGWYIQPDCNLPEACVFDKHSEFGRRYFAEKFNLQVKTAHHVDSFGHVVTMPDFFRRAGFENYVMMRPGEHEMHLPGNTFEWESPSGSRVRVFRISRAYCTTGHAEANIEANLEATLADANPEIGHTMCYIGVGNHGGGPARREIEWLNRHLHYRDGVELVYSSPDDFFAAVAASGAELPVVREELQHHAIGCYTAVSKIKRAVKQTTQLLHEAETMRHQRPDLFDDNAEKELNAGWKKLLFSTFHDILPGSSIASAYPDIEQDLGFARSVAQAQIELAIRRRNQQELTPCPRQQLIFDNTADMEFDGFVEFEPWLGYLWATPDVPRPQIRLTEYDGTPVASQELTPESVMPMARLTTRLRIPAHGRRKLLIHTDGALSPAGSVKVTTDQLNNQEITAKVDSAGVVSLQRNAVEFLRAPIRAEVIDDLSDTWSHDMKSYGVTASETFASQSKKPWAIRRNGPLSGELARMTSTPSGTLRWNVRLDDGAPALELRLKLSWHQAQKLVKLVIPPAFTPTLRRDGTPGGSVIRRCNGEEYPVSDFVSLTAENGQTLAVISREVSGADVQPDGTIRLTLLRSPYYAHHNPHLIPPESDYPVTDQGEHEYRIRLLLSAQPDEAAIRREAIALSEPVYFSESTDGCGCDFR